MTLAEDAENYREEIERDLRSVMDAMLTLNGALERFKEAFGARSALPASLDGMFIVISSGLLDMLKVIGR